MPSAPDSLRVRVAYEDVITFINAAFSCTGQREYYGARAGQQVSIAFLHEYMRVNYRRLYARCLAVDVNHFNRGRIITGLLSTTDAAEPSERALEGALVQVALRQLPAPRALDALDGLRRARVNNRRVRAVIRDYLAGRPDPDFDAVKYRGRIRALAAHAHLRSSPERARFLFGDPAKGRRSRPRCSTPSAGPTSRRRPSTSSPTRWRRASRPGMGCRGRASSPGPRTS